MTAGEAIPPAAAPRSCGSCGLCCKLVRIAELDKPAGRWCAHWKAGTGCRVYEGRPGECRAFACTWLVDEHLGDAWKPTRSHIVLYFVDDGRILVAHVDPSHPLAWRQSPYYEALKRWSADRVAAGLQVLVKIDDRVIVILPRREVDLGRVRPNDRIAFDREMTPNGLDFTARKIPAPDEPTDTRVQG